MIAGGIAAAVAVGIAITIITASRAPAGEDGSTVGPPIKVDYARVVPYENATDPASINRGYVMNVKLSYTEGVPPKPFYLLLLPAGESWNGLTTPQEWVRQEYHGFEVLSSSTKFDVFTEYYPFDSSLIPVEMRLYCEVCDTKWSEPETVWHGVDEKITKVRALGVNDGPQYYVVGFALSNDQGDFLPASGRVEFRLTDSAGATLFESFFDVKEKDFRESNNPIRLLRVPMSGAAFYEFAIPVEQILPSPTGKTDGFAFLSFILEDGRVLSGGTGGVKLPPK